MSIPTLKKTIDVDFDGTRKCVESALQAEGFGILTEIDVKATLKKKLDKDFRRYVILGACNPSLAHEALSTDLAVGVLLPCNVVLYELDDSHTVVEAIEPMTAIGGFGAEALQNVAAQVRERLDRVMAAL